MSKHAAGVCVHSHVPLLVSRLKLALLVHGNNSKSSTLSLSIPVLDLTSIQAVHTSKLNTGSLKFCCPATRLGTYAGATIASAKAGNKGLSEGLSSGSVLVTAVLLPLGQVGISVLSSRAIASPKKDVLALLTGSPIPLSRQTACGQKQRPPEPRFWSSRVAERWVNAASLINGALSLYDIPGGGQARLVFGMDLGTTLGRCSFLPHLSFFTASQLVFSAPLFTLHGSISMLAE
eukprot:1139379-Pelagomonas_calceolata.AAC.7